MDARPANSRNRKLLSLLGLVTAFAASGAACPQVLQQYVQPIPRALPAAPTLKQVMDVVNDNSSKVISFSSSQASISSPGMPSLRANIAFQRERNFRLRAETVLTGTELDLGSNEQIFWFWMRRNPQPVIFVCRHDQFTASAARQLLPVEPIWLIQALGLVSFDPNAQHQGPFPVGAGRIEIRSSIATPQGPMTRVAILDDSRALVLQQNLYDAQGNSIATAQLSKHVRDSASGVIMPRHVDVQWPTAKLEFSIDMSDLVINRLPPNSQELFTKPNYTGYTEVNLADPNLRLGPAPAAVPMQNGAPLVPIGQPPQPLMQPQQTLVQPPQAYVPAGQARYQ